MEKGYAVLLLLLLFLGVDATVQLEIGSLGEYVVIEAMSLSRNASSPPRIEAVIACTAVDLNMDPGDMCDTPGFSKKSVYPNGDASFGASLWKQSRVLMHGRTVRDGWPLVYLQVTTRIGDEVTRRVIRVPREIRSSAYQVESGHAVKLGVLGPVTNPPAGTHNDSKVRVLGLSLVGVFLAAFAVMAAIKGRLRRKIGHKVGPPRYDGRHYQLLLLGGDSPKNDKKSFTVRVGEVLTGVPGESGTQRRERLKREQIQADETWGVQAGVLAPPLVRPGDKK